MLETTNEISMLLMKYVREELSVDEKNRLQQWIDKSEHNKRVFESVANPDMLIAGFGGYMSELEEAKLNQHEQELGKVTQIPAHRSKRIFYAAASIVVLVTAAAIIYLINRKDISPAVTQLEPVPATQPVMPASDKATLTLSTGEQILLNDKNTGVLARDGKSVITKTADGQLIYNPHDKSAQAPNRSSHEVYNTMKTPRGGKYRVTLPDGSLVWLNAASELRFPVAFTGKQRTVELSGEAYFQISKDKLKPFIVAITSTAGQRQQIEVLGTHFNVGAYKEEPNINTTLLEGSIRYASGNQHMKVLAPGQHAVFDKQNGSLSVTKEEDPFTSIAWVNGQFSFEKNDLASVMRELSRWYDVEIRYDGTNSSFSKFSGQINRKIPLAELLPILGNIGGVDFTLNNRTITVKPKN